MDGVVFKGGMSMGDANIIPMVAFVFFLLGIVATGWKYWMKKKEKALIIAAIGIIGVISFAAIDTYLVGFSGDLAGISFIWNIMSAFCLGIAAIGIINSLYLFIQPFMGKRRRRG